MPDSTDEGASRRTRGPAPDRWDNHQSRLRLWSRWWSRQVGQAAPGNEPLLNEIHPKPCYPADTGAAFLRARTPNIADASTHRSHRHRVPAEPAPGALPRRVYLGCVPTLLYPADKGIRKCKWNLGKTFFLNGVAAQNSQCPGSAVLLRAIPYSPHIVTASQTPNVPRRRTPGPKSALKHCITSDRARVPGLTGTQTEAAGCPPCARKELQPAAGSNAARK